MNNDNVIPQSVYLINRSKMELEGIIDVECFTDTAISIVSTLGKIAIDGSELKVESFSTDSGKLILKGNIDGFCYYGREKKKKKLLSSRGDKK